MAINKIGLSNFKSFKNLDVELGKFNVFVGANASGKSSFIQTFKFIRDMANHGLNNAIKSKRFNFRIDFMSEILKLFCIDTAKMKNGSFSYFIVDMCMLYVFRCAVYYLEEKR